MATDLAQQFCALRDTYIEKQFGRLNDMQREAVFTTNGPLLILAGAGSGKTTVLVNRIANLIQFGSAHGSKETPRPVTEEDVKALRTAIMTGTDAPSWLDGMLRQNAVRSWNVMAITFTNKAAGELKERLRRMLGGEEGDEVFASTFHSACVRILRRWAEEIGYPRSFTIYDTDDAQRVMKTVYKELSIDDKFLPIKAAINQMSADGTLISFVTSKARELSKYMANVLDEEWNQNRGMQVQSVGIGSLSYDEESQKLINMRNQGAMLSDPSVREGYVQGLSLIHI